MDIITYALCHGNKDTDVSDIVQSYSSLLNYDTSHLVAGSIIKVLEDENEEGKISYYRYTPSEQDTWTLVGTQGPYYTTAQSDQRFITKENPTGTGYFSLNRKPGTIAGENSVAFNYDTTASGQYSFASGESTIASGRASHAEGRGTIAGGKAFKITSYEQTDGQITSLTLDSTAGLEVGMACSAYMKNTDTPDKTNNFDNFGTITSIESATNTVEFDGSFAWEYTIGDSCYLWVIGRPDLGTQSIGENTVALGIDTVAQNDSALAQGRETLAAGKYAVSMGRETKAIGYASEAHGRDTTASGKYAIANGKGSTATADNSFAEGYRSSAEGENSHAEGQSTISSGNSTHAEGRETIASGTYSHAEGAYTKATGNNSHAEGFKSEAKYDNTHAEGQLTVAEGNSAHAEGRETRALGGFSHAEGYKSSATGNQTHAEGRETRASASFSHAEGYVSNAAGEASHAEGSQTEALHEAAHAEGLLTSSGQAYQHVAGKHNVKGTLGARVTGWGTSASKRNIEQLTDTGDLRIAGNVYVECDDNSDNGFILAKKPSILDIDATPEQEETQTVINLVDNTEYYITNVSAIEFSYPQSTHWECYIKLTTVSQGTLTITFPNSAYIGSMPTFNNGETWEISIKDGVIVVGKVEADE